MIKFEYDRLVVIDGFYLVNEQILPVNQLAVVFKDAANVWTVKQLKFEDEQFRQPKDFNPNCQTLYSSHVPQMHFVGYQKKGYLEVKQVLIDPTSLSKNTYEEINTFEQVPQRLSKSCTLALGRSMIIVYSIDANTNKPMIYSSDNNLSDLTRIYQSRFGVQFCKEGYVGSMCEPVCPNSRSYSKPLLTLR